MNWKHTAKGLNFKDENTDNTHKEVPGYLNVHSAMDMLGPDWKIST